jgi:hypothetical protein
MGQLLLSAVMVASAAQKNNEQGNRGRPTYKTKNDNYFWFHGYQVGMKHTRATCTDSNEGHKLAATNTNIMIGDTWGSEFL